MANPIFQGVRRILVEEGYVEQRLDNFLLNLLKTIPKTRIYRIIRRGEVRVNGKRTQAGYRLQINDEIRLPPVYEDPKPAALLPSADLKKQLFAATLYEDERLLIINKPSGVPVHGGIKSPVGIIEAMRSLHPEWPQLELVHRLDLETSGCLILAKKRSTLRELHTMLREGGMYKAYLALTLGYWQPKDYRVNVPLEKNHLVSGERIVRPAAAGKAALTVFRPITVYQNATLVEAVLHTGRTHQIRVHARYRGHPLAGDQKYGNKAFNQQMRALGLRRLFLHAAKVAFTLPSTGMKYVVKAPLETHLETFLKMLTPGP